MDTRPTPNDGETSDKYGLKVPNIASEGISGLDDQLL